MRKGAYVLGILATLVPFGFGAIRAITSGSDFRYIWMALAAALALASVAIASRGIQAPNEILARSGGVCLLATLLAAAAGYLLGARSPVSVGIVAVSFGLCEAAGFAFTMLSRRGRTPVA